MSAGPELLALLLVLGAEPSTEPVAAVDEAGSELELFELDASLSTQTQIASQKATAVRVSPGIISVVTREEMLNAGARDLMDVLQLIPGFFFGVDVEGVVGPAVRGNWAHEGKVLFIVDGQEMNEILFASVQLGNHFPVDQLQSVEVIRGPGSALYGGYAELAVVKVTTRSAKDHDGAAAGVTYGQLPTALGRLNLSLSAAHDFQDVPGLAVSTGVFVGAGNRSDALYQDLFGNSYRMGGQSHLDPLFANIGITYKDLAFRLIYDRYAMTSGDGYDEALPAAEPLAFHSLFTELSWSRRITERMDLVARFNFLHQEPWQNVDPDSALVFDRRVDRYRGRVRWAYDIIDMLSVAAGADVYFDHARSGPVTAEAGPQTYANVAGFAEVSSENPIVNAVAGVRIENHSAFGFSIVPRVALTKAIGRFHAKALFSRAFRAPSVDNIRLGFDNIKPERTTVFELEAGYQITDGMALVLNAFDTQIGSPIVYYYDEATNEEGYYNFRLTGSRGIEAQYRLRGNWGYANLSYSFYSAAGKNGVPLYEVPGLNRANLGLPNHQLTATGHVKIWRGLSLNPTVLFFSDRAAYVPDGAGSSTLGALPATVLVNAFLRWEDLGVRGLDVGVGIYNALNTSFAYAQPYNAGHAPLPSQRRELLARVTYQVPF